MKSIFDPIRRALIPIVLLLAAAGMLWFVDGREPLRTWMVWPYLGFWAATAAWVAACTSVGHAALRLLPRLVLPLRERLLFDFATGVLLFAVGLFVAGVLGLIRPPFFFIYPLLLAATGARPLALYLRRARRHFRALRGRAWPRQPTPYLAYAYGTLGITVVYLTIMLPENAAFDARTYHLAIAEHYVASGRIGKFVEGWVAGVIPHLASWLYTWPFTLRSVNLFAHVELCAHIEFALFVATVFSVPLLVEAICPGRRARGTWAVVFLFPGLFLYDSSVSLAADHVAAFWAVPIALALRRVLRRPSAPGPAVLCGLMVAGAAMTKYQSMYLVIPAVLLVAVVAAREAWRARRDGASLSALRARLGSGPAVFAVALLAATSPHWLANVIWYGDPLYPMLAAWLPDHPMVKHWAGAVAAFSGGMKEWMTTGPFLDRVRQSALATLTFSFVPHDWPNFHRDLPVFGFLFTLTLPVLALVRGGGRARLLAGGTLLGVFIWYWTFHQDRYLQALLPWMAATTSAALLFAWHSNLASRLAATVLVAAQLVWGNDIPWLPTHAMIRDVPAIRSLHMLSSTYRGEVSTRFEFPTGFEALDRALPRDATVLLHEDYLRLGLNRRTIGDSARLQPAIDYTQLRRPDRVHDLLSSMGTTHLIWNLGGSANREVPVSGELVFFGYALRYTEGRQRFGPFEVGKLPTHRPPVREPGLVAYIGCQRAVDVPLTDIDAVVGGEQRGTAHDDPADAIAAAEFVVIEIPCHARATPQAMSPFVEAPRWGDLTLWVRRN